MGRDIVEQRWSQLRERVTTWWDRVTDADLDRIDGQREALVQLLRERYGYGAAAAHAELGRRLREYAVEGLRARRRQQPGRPFLPWVRVEGARPAGGRGRSAAGAWDGLDTPTP